MRHRRLRTPRSGARRSGFGRARAIRRPHPSSANRFRAVTPAPARSAARHLRRRGPGAARRHRRHGGGAWPMGSCHSRLPGTAREGDRQCGRPRGVGHGAARARTARSRRPTSSRPPAGWRRIAPLCSCCSASPSTRRDATPTPPRRSRGRPPCRRATPLPPTPRRSSGANRAGPGLPSKDSKPFTARWSRNCRPRRCRRSSRSRVRDCCGSRPGWLPSGRRPAMCQGSTRWHAEPMPRPSRRSTAP